MSVDESLFEVPLDGFTLHLRRSELEAVAAGLGEFDASEEGDLITLAEALGQLPERDRAPTWELALRRFGHHKPLAQAASEIGLDEVHARALLEQFTRRLAEVPAPEHAGLESAAATRARSAETPGSATAHAEAGGAAPPDAADEGRSSA